MIFYKNLCNYYFSVFQTKTFLYVLEKEHAVMFENCHQTNSNEIADMCVPKYLPRFCTWFKSKCNTNTISVHPSLRTFLYVLKKVHFPLEKGSFTVKCKIVWKYFHSPKIDLKMTSEVKSKEPLFFAIKINLRPGY